MVRSLLIRGMLAGLFAGLVGFAFAYVFGEPPLEQAITYEEGLPHEGDRPSEPVVVTRDVQSTIGLLTGTVTVGLALGGLYSLVFAYVYGRLGAHGVRTTSLMLSLAAFLTVSLLPFIKYPPNPPAVGSAATVDQRTALFVATIVISMVALLAAVRLRAKYLDRMSPWNATILACVSFLALIGLAQAILPGVGSTPVDFPADVLFEFRLAALGMAAVMWMALGLMFGAIVDRLIRGVTPE